MVRKAMLLSFEEIRRLVTLMAGMGVRRVRLTGGEPTIRKGIVGLVESLAAIEGIQELAMTTNAHLLESMAQPLADAGLKSINVSIDTVDPVQFAELTVRGDLAKVTAGIEASVEAGLRVSLNAVALRSLNSEQLAAICEFAWSRGVIPRFIEHMPMSGGDAYHAENHISAAEIREAISAEVGHSLHPIGGTSGRGPAQYWKVGDTNNQFGIISAMSEHFCDTCNRLRLSATGQLHTCLAHDDSADLRRLLRRGHSDDDVRAAIQTALRQKRQGHEFDVAGNGGPQKHMISIGG